MASQRLEYLFAHYAAELRRFAPKLTDHFGCPLCWRIFKRVKDLREIVAEEHVLSRKLGGRIVTLTCKGCNSNHGSQLDAHLVQRVRIEANKRPFTGRFRMGTVGMGAEIYPYTQPDAPIDIKVIKKQSDKRQVDEIKRLLTAREEIHLHMNFGYNENRSLVGLVRSAYLLMFRTFGYRYVLDPSATRVREQIQNPIQTTPVLDGIMWRMPDAEKLRHTLGIIMAPQSIQSFAVILRLDDETDHVAGVTFPSPGTDGAELYQRLQLPEAQGMKTIYPLPIGERRFLPFVETWSAFVGGNAP